MAVKEKNNCRYGHICYIAAIPISTQRSKQRIPVAYVMVGGFIGSLLEKV